MRPNRGVPRLAEFAVDKIFKLFFATYAIHIHSTRLLTRAVLSPHRKIRREAFSHLQPGAMQIGFQFADRMARDGADLFVALFVKNLQAEDDPLVVVERDERLLDRLGQLAVEHRAFRQDRLRFQPHTFRFVQSDFHIVFSRLPRRFARHIARDPEEPGREPQVVPQSAQVAVGADEGLLRQLFGQLTIMDKIMDEAEHGTAVAVEDQVESLFVAALRPSHHARSYFRKRHPYFSVGLSAGFFSRFLIFDSGYRIVHLRSVSVDFTMKVSNISPGFPPHEYTKGAKNGWDLI